MRFRVQKLLNASIGARQIELLEYGQTRFDEGLRVDFLRGQVVFTRTHIGVIVGGAFETQTEVQCVRSLEQFKLPLAIVLEDALFAFPRHPPPDDDEDRVISDDGYLDLTETLRQSIVLAIPINPISPKYQTDDELSALVDGETADWLSVKWSAPADAHD